MNAGDCAAQVLAGGLAETVSVLPYAIAAAIGVLAVTGTGFVLLFMGRARLERMRGEVGDDTPAESGGTSVRVCPCCNAWSDDCICTADCGMSRCQAHDPEVIDDALPMFFEHKPQPAPWPDGDTVIADGLSAELERMLKGDGRGD